MIMKRLCLFLLFLISFGFPEPEALLFSDKIQSELVTHKLESAPVAYYGSLVDIRFYDEERLRLEHFDQTLPLLYKTFVNWKNTKKKRQDSSLSAVPEIYRKTVELRNAMMNIDGYVLLHYVVNVEKIYDKGTKTWKSPKPGESKKNIFIFAYVGTEMPSGSSNSLLVQRVIAMPSQGDFWPQDVPKKRIFFLDGFSAPCAFLDNYSLRNVRYYPYRLKYDVEVNRAIEVREQMTSLIAEEKFDDASRLVESADLSHRSKILLKVLNRDYEFIQNEDSTALFLSDYNDFYYRDDLDSLLNKTVLYKYLYGSYCSSIKNLAPDDSANVCDVVKDIALRNYPVYKSRNKSDRRFYRLAFDFDVGPLFFKGTFPDFDPIVYYDFGFSIYTGKMIWGYEVGVMSLDAKCDSCGTSDFGMHLIVGYSWLKTKYVEGAGFVNLGFSLFEVPPQRGNSEGRTLYEGYFRYGVGAFFDLLTPDLTRNPSESKYETRLGLRLKFGVNNVNVSDVGHADGFAPYISLGLTWQMIEK